MGHLGSRVSALLDGRLSAEEEERAWAHVHTCHPCRDLVEREGWVKTRLAGLSASGGAAPDGLKHSLLGGGVLAPLAAEAFPAGPAWLRHRGLLAIGGGAAGAAVVGVLALGAATGGGQLERRAPASELNGPAPTTSVDRTQTPTRRPQARPTRGIVIREKMDW